MYDGWKPILEWDGAGNWRAWNIYGAGSDEILMRYDTTVGHSIYKLDRMGNVRAILDAGGNIVEAYAYDAFGQPTVSNWDGSGARSDSTRKNRFMFTGREWIKEFGIYDYRNRFYHPKLGRFLQPDPLGFAAGDVNLFRYCGGDPVNYIDPYGLDKEPPPKQSNVPRAGWANHPPNVQNLTSRGGGGMWQGPEGFPSGGNGGYRESGGGGGGLTMAWLNQPLPPGEVYAGRIVVTPQGSFISSIPTTYRRARVWFQTWRYFRKW